MADEGRILLQRLFELNHGMADEVHYESRHFNHYGGTINVEIEDFDLFFNFDELAATLFKCLIL